MGRKHKKHDGAGRGIGGQLRGAAAPLAALAASPMVLDLIASGLVAAAQGVAKRGAGTAKATEESVEVAEAAVEKTADIASLAGYAAAIAAAEIAARFIESYEQRLGDGKRVRRTAKGARKAADMAWSAFAAKHG